MVKYLLVANVGQLVKAMVSNTVDAPIGSRNETYSSMTPIATHDTPLGICKQYQLNNLYIYIIPDKIAVEVDEAGTIKAEMNFKFDSNTQEFKYASYMLICFIVGHVIGGSERLYANLVTSYLEKILFNKYDTAINFEYYNVFKRVEEEIFNITDHVSLQEVIFQKGMESYLDGPTALEIAAMDITGCENLFKARDIYFI